MLGDFRYVKPATVAEALDYIAEPGSIVLAGGTDLLLKLRSGRLRPRLVVDIKAIGQFRGIERQADGSLRIGALTSVQEVAASSLAAGYQALAEGARVLGCLEIRHRATVGGNICNASPGADTVPGLLLYDAQAVVIGKAGQRVMPVWELLAGPGKVNLQGELLQAILLPPPADGAQSRYYRRSRVKGMDLAGVGVAVYAQDGASGGATQVRIALGAVLPVVSRMRDAEALLAGKPLTPALMEEAIQIITARIDPRKDSLRADPTYKKEMVSVFIRQALADMIGGERVAASGSHNG